MFWPAIIAGFTLGATGSLHCIGMCGPLSLALPTSQLAPLQRFTSLFLYQVGRMITYSILGLLIGLAGSRVFISGYQQVFSILLGIVIITMAIFYFVGNGRLHSSLTARIYAPIQKLILRLMRRAKNPPGFFFMGMANGLLPCGMVYVALVATLSFSSVTESVSFMAMFGAGTLPAMMMVGYAGRIITYKTRLSIKKMIPLFIALTGLILILRGLNLGIPFLSPILPPHVADAIDCRP
jgi:sulfite exporter TauE/SafE